MIDHIVLLPGLDGTGRLFRSFVEITPDRFTVDVERYPADKALSYDDLETRLRAELPEARPFWLLAESFSGPLAARLGSNGLAGLLGIIFVCSFVRSPRPFWMRALPWSLLCRLPASVQAVHWGFEARGGPQGLVGEMIAARRSVEPRVIAARLRFMSAVDESASLRRCTVPTLYLRARRDRLVLRGSGRHIQQLKPDTQLAVLDTSHLLLQTAPAAAWFEIESFIDQHRPAA